MKGMLCLTFAIPLVCGLGVCLMGCPPGVDSAFETVTATVNIAVGGSLSMENVNGAITVTGGNGNEVVIEARKRVDVYRTWGSGAEPEEFLDDLEVLIDEDDGNVSIQTVVPSALFTSGVVSVVDYTVTVPRNIDLSIENSNGRVEVAEVTGGIVIDNVNGSVETEDTTGDLDITIANGNANIEHEDTLQTDESITVDIENGSVSISLPEDSAFDITAETTVGSISDGGFDFTVEPRNVTGRVVNDTVNGGGAQMDVDVNVGSISFRAL